MERGVLFRKNHFGNLHLCFYRYNQGQGGGRIKDLLIDFGSTFVKIFVCDGDTVLFSDKLDFPEPCVDDRTAFRVPIHRIDKLIEDIFDCAQPYGCDRCFISIQMHGYVMKDSAGAFGDYVSWRDKTADVNHPLAKEIDFEVNGTSVKNNLAVLKLLREPQNEPREFFTLGSYVAYRITGKNITHRTDGCASGFFHGRTLQPLTVVKNLTLPTVTKDMRSIGSFRGIEIFTPAGDHQVSFLGSGAEDQAYLLNIGTATQLCTLSETFVQNKGIEKRPYFNEQYLLTVTGLPGGAKLYEGFSKEAFLEEILDAVKKMPHKSHMLVGGGGAELVFDEVKAFFEPYGITCSKMEHNISLEGMKKMSDLPVTEIGTMLSEVCFPNFPVILKNCNMDFLIVDNEHGAFDYAFFSSVVMTSRLVDLPLIVRLSDNHRKDITKLVDMGVTGFLLPMTNSPEDIKAVVDYAKYTPIGKRGISTNRAHTFYNPPPIGEYMEQANRRVRVFAQIETREGVAKIDEILAVNGVDGVFVGPNDLACDMGCIGNTAPVKEAIARVAAAARAAGKRWGIITNSKDLLDCSLENGVGYISYGSEINMLKDSCKTIRNRIYG